MVKFKKYYPDFKLKAVTFSFDDGTVQDIEMINIFNRLNLKATFNINSKLMNHNGNYLIDGWLLNYKIHEKDINIIYKNHEVAGHSSTHSDFKDCSEQNLIKEIDEDISYLSNVINEKVVGFAYPFGIYNDKIIKHLKDNGIIYARSTKSDFSFNIPTNWYTFGGTCTISDKEFPKLVRKWNNTNYKTMKLFYIWGHSYELDMYHEHEHVYKQLVKIANKEDVYYATNKDIFCYLDAFNKLSFDKKTNTFINESKFDLFIEYKKQKMIIKGKEK